MNLLSISNLTKNIGTKVLFKDISFGIDEGDKIGLVGVNGSGKTTLLKLLSGSIDVDSGNIFRNNQLKISYLWQNITYSSTHTIEDHIFRGDSPKIQLLKKYYKCCEDIVKDESKQEEMSRIISEMDKVNAWSYETTIKSILEELNISNLKMKMSNLSGGNLKKVGLAQVLIEDYNLLILDEPTNHLDIDTIIWLQNFLTNLNKTIILVTHDRYFLDLVVNKIFEIDFGVLNVFKGNYNYYLEKKAEMDTIEALSEEKAKSFLRNELEWLKRQPKARGTKQKARMDRIQDVMNRDRKEKSNEIEFSVSGRRLGKKVLEIQNVTKAYSNDVVVNNFSYVFKKKERIGIIGANGCGKSTLLNILTEKIKPDSGFVSVGMNTHFGYFEQINFEFDETKTVIDYVKKNAGEYVNYGEDKVFTASKMLERFLFPPNLQHTEIKKISGGERRRLVLVTILMKNPNFLLLDEPTNDLDIKTLSILEDFIEVFPGCVLVVSHDRYFLDRIVDYLLVFQNDKTIHGFPGNYSEYLDYKKDLDSLKNQKEKDARKDEQTKQNKNTKKLSYKEKKELENIEQEIESLENEKKEVEESIPNLTQDYNELNKASLRLNEINHLLEEKFTRWEYLSEKD